MGATERAATTVDVVVGATTSFPCRPCFGVIESEFADAGGIPAPLRCSQHRVGDVARAGEKAIFFIETLFFKINLG